jgi:hypothetical protein
MPSLRHNALQHNAADAGTIQQRLVIHARGDGQTNGRRGWAAAGRGSCRPPPAAAALAPWPQLHECHPPPAVARIATGLVTPSRSQDLRRRRGGWQRGSGSAQGRREGMEPRRATNSSYNRQKHHGHNTWRVPCPAFAGHPWRTAKRPGQCPLPPGLTNECECVPLAQNLLVLPYAANAALRPMQRMPAWPGPPCLAHTATLRARVGATAGAAPRRLRLHPPRTRGCAVRLPTSTDCGQAGPTYQSDMRWPVTGQHRQGKAVNQPGSTAERSQHPAHAPERARMQRSLPSRHHTTEASYASGRRHAGRGGAF